jgi:surface antigen
VVASSLPAPLLHRRRLLTALACGAVLALGGLIVPARGLATDTSWTPSPASLLQASRACPSPVAAVYYKTTCWTVVPDQSSPFYWPDGPYAWGQCTYWALEMRPDLWNNRSAADPNPGDWTAYTWPQHAALEGLTVDHAPAAGAVIVWPRSADSDAGHVAYVQSVGVDSATGDDLVTLQEMNDTTFDDPALGQGDTMTMSMDPADLSQVQIIHAPSPARTTTPSRTAPTTATKTSRSTARHRRPRHSRLRRRERRHQNHSRRSRRRVMLTA